MRSTIILAILVLTAPAVAAAQPEWKPWLGDQQPWTTREDVARQAHELSDRALRLYRVLRRVEGYGQVTEDARSLAISAEQLHENVEAGAPYSATMDDYYDLQQSLFDVRETLFEEHRVHYDEQVQRAWGRVMGAHEQLALTLNVPAEALCEPTGTRDRPHIRVQPPEYVPAPWP